MATHVSLERSNPAISIRVCYEEIPKQGSLAGRIVTHIMDRFTCAAVVVGLPGYFLYVQVVNMVKCAFSSLEMYFGFIMAGLTFGRFENINDLFAEGCIDTYNTTTKIIGNMFGFVYVEALYLLGAVIHPEIALNGSK
jgi:hypothetical protein